MTRRNFSQILKDANIDIRREYDRLYAMFYEHKIPDEFNNIYMTFKELCEMQFVSYPHRGTCLSLEDFNDFYGFNFEKKPEKFNIDYLVGFCEYTYNLLIYFHDGFCTSPFIANNPKQLFLTQINKVIESIGYMSTCDAGITIFVPKSAEMIATSEIVDNKISYKVIQYNHHSMKGDIEGKKAIILLMAGELEGRRKELSGINKTLETNLFFLFNSVNLRHDNVEKNSNSYIEFISNMTMDELESWYDETYQLCLLAFLELDNLERNKKIAELKDNTGKGR